MTLVTLGVCRRDSGVAVQFARRGESRHGQHDAVSQSGGGGRVSAAAAVATVDLWSGADASAALRGQRVFWSGGLADQHDGTKALKRRLA